MSIRKAMLYPVARRFFAGTSLEAAIARIKENARHGIGTTIDFLGEDVTDASEADRAKAQYKRAIKAISFDGLDASVAFKLTHIGLDISPVLAENNALELGLAAREKGVFLWMDMEGSQHTGNTIAIYKKMRGRGIGAGIALQTSLKRSWEDLVDLAEAGAKIRLVKGAYNEPPEVALQEMDEIRPCFVEMAGYLAGRSLPFAVGTHDTAIIDRIKALGDGEKVEYQMLMGLRERLKSGLVREGLRVVEYVPYGTDWYAYGIRRIAEKKRNMLYFAQGLIGR